MARAARARGGPGGRVKARVPSTAGRSPGAPHTARPGPAPPPSRARERAEASGAPTHLCHGRSRPGSSCRKCGARRCVVRRSISARSRRGRGPHPAVRRDPARRALPREPSAAQCWAPSRVCVFVSPALRQGLALEPRCRRQGPARRGHPENSHLLASVEQIVYLIPAQCWATVEGTTEINLSWVFSSGCSSRLRSAFTF